jgi:hypothetical protein
VAEGGSRERPQKNFTDSYALPATEPEPQKEHKALA